VSFIEQTRGDVVEPEWGDPAVPVAEGVLEDIRDEVASTAVEDVEPASTNSYFDGDEGGLYLEERRALVVLLKNRFITSESHPKEWNTLVVSRQAISKRLNDLFLELKFDAKREVAYKRPVSSDTGGRDFPTLMHDTIWQREETALLVFLRVQARNDEIRGEVQSPVSEADMLEFLRDNRPDSATNQVSDDKRVGRAIKALTSAGLLMKTNEDGVFRISAAIETMLPAPVLNNLLTWINVRNESGPEIGPETEAEPTEEESS
jgi:hypothetical protein